jgi:hypothetical protein
LSVRAGFLGDELTSIWPDDRSHWQVQEREAGLFSHVFHATRRDLPTTELD